MRAVLGEIAQKRISGAERKKAQLDALHGAARRKNAIDDFVRGAVSAHSQESAVSLIVSFAREFRGVAGTGGSDHVDAQPVLAQSGECASGKLRRAPAACGGIDDSNEFFVHKVPIRNFTCFEETLFRYIGQDCRFAIELCPVAPPRLHE